MKKDINSNLRKHFDSIVIEVLEEVNSGRMPKGIKFAELFKKAEEEEVNIDEWEGFIREELIRFMV